MVSTNTSQPRLVTTIRRKRPKVETTPSISSRTMMLSKDLKPYDIMEDLDKLQPTITMKQLLAVAPQYRSSLSLSMIRRKPRPAAVSRDCFLTKKHNIVFVKMALKDCNCYLIFIS